MNVELPKPEDTLQALTSIPPKLSTLIKPLAIPEELFENTVRQVAGVEVPPGPSKMLIELMASFEEGAPTLGLGAGRGKPTTYREREGEKKTTLGQRTFKEF